MTTFAAVVFDPGIFAAWIIAGAICGWLACKVMEAPSYGFLGEVLVGSIGALVGGLMFGLLKEGDPGWSSALVALLGACILIAGARVLAATRAE